ncbi:MAG: Lrp/AsnC ligand binding domain-containing protein [Pseudomonadota bacterium]
MIESTDLDDFDRKILHIVSANGRISVTELAKKIGLSKTPCQMRLKRLEKAGVIVGYQAILDPVKLGLDHIAFVEVKLSDTTESALSEFNRCVTVLPEVEQCHMIAGSYDYLLKVRTQNMRDYRRILGEVISSLPHVANTSTYVSMEAVKDELFEGQRL